MPETSLIPNEYILKKRPEISWYRWIQMVWNDVEWPTVIALGVISLVLGIIGFYQYGQTGAFKTTFLNILYQSLQLFSMQAAFDTNLPLPVTLQIARFLSPALAVYTLFQAFLEVFKTQLQLFRLVRVRNHAIVCGLGQKGLLLVKDLRKTNRPVAVIEQNSNNPHLEICRDLGVIVVNGDARESMILLKAGIRRAEQLFVVCGDDGVNVDVAELAQRLIQEQDARHHRSGLLNCVIHISDIYLWTVLKEREFAKDQASSFRLEMFNIYDAGARILLRETIQYNTGKTPHLLIIGMGRLAENLIIHAARGWYLHNKVAGDKLIISVVDPEATYKLKDLQVRYPLILHSFDTHAYDLKSNWLDFYKGIFLSQTPDIPVTNAFVCVDDPSSGWKAGFTLLNLLKNQGTQIMVRMAEDTGLAAFVREAKSPELQNISAFGLLERTCKLGLLDDGTHEALARVIHEDFCKREQAKDVTPEMNPNLVPWDQLSAEIKESNRRQADHISVKLHAIDCRMVPWRDSGAEIFVFKPEAIEKMAKMEHTRWYEEKIRDDWRFGEKRDDTRKIHPDLVEEWQDPRLTDEAKHKDRDAVILIPHLLAQAGFQIVEKESVFGGGKRKTAG
jgi:hypothetical protein